MRTSWFNSKSRDQDLSIKRDIGRHNSTTSVRTSSELSQELEGLVSMREMMDRSQSNTPTRELFQTSPLNINDNSLLHEDEKNRLIASSVSPNDLNISSSSDVLPMFTQVIQRTDTDQSQKDNHVNSNIELNKDSSSIQNQSEQTLRRSIQLSKEENNNDDEEEKEEKQKYPKLRKNKLKELNQQSIVSKKNGNNQENMKENEGDDNEKNEMNENAITSNERILVVCRIRPRPLSKKGGKFDNLEEEEEDHERESDKSQLIVIDENDTTVLTLMAEPTPIPFKFDYVAGETSTQEELFARVGRPLAQAVISGYNATAFAYGQTGSGKTHTMFGGREGASGGQDMRGLIPRCLDFIFTALQRTKRSAAERRSSTIKKSVNSTANLDHAGDFHCSCQFLEVYMEQVHDLLDPTCPVLKVRENLDHGVFVEGVVEEDILDAAAANKLLMIGEKHRHVAATAMNHVSSRSHAIFTLKVSQAVEHHEEGDSQGSSTKTLVSKFNLVDLAGSERQQDAHTEGTRLKEASGINKSLSNLGLVIQALVDRAEGKRRHVHYRDSKVTYLLRDSLGGNSKTTMLCNVSGQTQNFGETLSSLRFAARAKEIPCHAEVNEEYSLADVKVMIRQLRALKTENAELKALLNKFRGQSPTAPISNGYANGTILGTSRRTNTSTSPRPSAEKSPRRRRSPRGFDQGGVNNIQDNRWLRNSTGYEDFLGVSQTPLVSSRVASSPLDRHPTSTPTTPLSRRSSRRADMALLSDGLDTVTETKEHHVGDNSRAKNNLEGLVNQLEIEKTNLEDDLDEAEAASNVLQGECKDLAAQVVYLQVRLREAEDKSNITTFKTKIESLQKEVTRHKKASKTIASSSQEEKEHSELLAKKVNDLEYELAASQIESSRLRREMAERDKEISMMRSLGVTTTTGDKVTIMPRNQSPYSESNFSMVSSVDERNTSRNPIVRKPPNRTIHQKSLTSVPSSASLVSSTYSSPTSCATSPTAAVSSPTAISVSTRLGLSTSYASPKAMTTSGASFPSSSSSSLIKNQTNSSTSTQQLQSQELSDRLARLSAPISMGTHQKSKQQSLSSSSSRDLRHTIEEMGESKGKSKTSQQFLKKKTGKKQKDNDEDNGENDESGNLRNNRQSLSRSRDRHQSMSNITFQDVTVNNILNNSHVTFNKNDDEKRLTPKQLRTTSKTRKVEERKQNKIIEKAEKEAKIVANTKADQRIGDALLSYEIEELYNIGFFKPLQLKLNDNEGEVSENGLYDVIDFRKNAARGVRTKSLTQSGGEASLSQTLAEHRMAALNQFFESKWPESLRDNLDLFDEFGSSLLDDDDTGSGGGGSRVDLVKDILPVLLKLETKLERGHGLLEILSVLHSAGGSETVAAVFAAAAIAPGASFWESVGVKIEKVRSVALRASDHCRLAVAVAKSTLLRKRVKNDDLSIEQHEDILQQLIQLKSQATLLSAETIHARGSLFEIFGESSFDSRTRKQDELLSLAISRGNKEVESASYLINENLRMVKMNETHTLGCGY